MAIGNAVQKGTWVYVYDERGRALKTLAGELHGFTGTTVVIRRGTWLYTFDEKGRQLALTSAR